MDMTNNGVTEQKPGRAERGIVGIAVALFGIVQTYGAWNVGDLWRDQNGAFKSRDQLKSVPRLGDKTFEQAAGFLRVMDGDNPLDRSAVYP